MLRSMTGFGRATATAGATEATVEVRAVNGRFAEVAVRGPRIVGAFEPAIQAGVKEALGRGSVTVGVSIQRRGDETGLVVDAGAARQYATLLTELRDAAGLTPAEAPVTLESLLRYPEVIAPAAEDDDAARTELPRTASSTPAVLMFGLLALALGVGVSLGSRARA